MSASTERDPILSGANATPAAKSSGNGLRGYFVRYAQLVHGHGGALALVALLFLATSAFESAMLPLIFRRLIDDVLTPRNHALLFPILSVLIVSGVAYAVAAVGRDILHARLA